MDNVNDEQEYVMINSVDFNDVTKVYNKETSMVSSWLYTTYKAMILFGDISHLYGVIYLLFHLYSNTATYTAISTIGHGPFLIFYITFFKLRRLL